MTTPYATGTREALDMVKRSLDAIAEQVVPWFYDSMHEYYLRTHAPDEQVRHLQAIITGRVVPDSQTVRLASPDGKRITYLSPAGDGSELLCILHSLLGSPIETARLYTTADGQLCLSEFLLSPQGEATAAPEAFAEALEVMAGEGVPPEEREAFRAFLTGASTEYVEKFDPVRALRHFRMAQMVGGGEDTALLLEPCVPGMETRLVVAMRNPPSSGLLYEIARILRRLDIRLHRAYGDVFRSPEGGDLAILSFYVTTAQGDLTCAPLLDELQRMLQLVKWLAPHELESYADTEGWALRRIMLVRAASEFAHTFLVRENQWAFSSQNVVRVMQSRRAEVAALVDWFEARFDPLRKDRVEAAARLAHVCDEMLAAIGDEQERAVLAMVQTFFRHTLRTNYYLDGIYGLGFRLDPAFLPASSRNEGEELPYGIIFVSGPRCSGFHVRYRDMARGGVRVVPTRTQEQLELESTRLYAEVRGLAYAQQVKNKDIPEGGSKAVILLAPGGDIQLAVASFANSLLDLILPSEGGHTLPGVVDYLGKEEIIYLGPDENITPEHIMWIVNRARQRGYRWPSAFMSSKPGAGINHKEYGVTSLGVMVFAEEMLRHLGIDPHSQPFTVKITGGPKGDVAGNLMRIMFRDYGDRARVVAVTDGHGAAYDPEGLNRAELLRLVDEQQSIDAFDKGKLKGQGAFVVSSRDPEGARIRNNLHNTAKADIFIPSGGRPDTINARNWQDFFDASGAPSARAIIEGANLFVSPEARRFMAERGVLVMHGSSANKTGVICSSYEVLGGLVMSDDEFMAVKPRFVDDVMAILRRRARDEARLLLSEARRGDGTKPLHVISVEASLEMNEAADALYAALCAEGEDVRKDHVLANLVREYCPPVLVERYGERIFQKVPARHLNALVAAYAASRIVYAEGTGWLAGLMQQRSVRDVVHTWLEEDARVTALAAAVREAGFAEAPAAAALLERSGRRRAVVERLGLL